ncbi:MAG TPA: hypothetical protein VF960_06585, partial [Chloroflexota bacterium]
MAFRTPNVSKKRPTLTGHKILWLGVLLAVVVFGLTFTLTVHLVPSRYELHEGEVSGQNIRAPKRVQYPSAIETRAERERAANSVQEVLALDPAVAPQQRTKLITALQTVGATRATSSMSVDTKKAAIKKALEIDLSDAQLSLLVGMDDFQWQMLSVNAPRVLFEVLSERVTAERLRDLRVELPARLSTIGGEQERALAVDLVNGYARVNYAPNPAETQRLRKEAQDSVPPVTKTIEKGEIILREGDVVRAADLEKLEALGLATPAVEWPDIASSFLLVV